MNKNLDDNRSKYVHNSFNKIDLHESFKYTNGFLDTDCSICPEFRYDSVEPLYSKPLKS